MLTTATARFTNLDEEKRDRIEKAAIREFVAHGFEGANTNRIAALAGVSVGSLFKYFETKADLFLHVVQAGSVEIEQLVSAILEGDGPVLGKVEALLQLVAQTSRAEREVVQLYHELSGQGNAKFVEMLAFKLERYTSAAFTELMKQGQASGEIRTDIDASLLAFMMDNLLVTLQYSLACDYFEERLRLYLPEAQDEELVAGALAFLTGALASPPQA